MIKTIFEKIAPSELAYPNDPIGLQLGSWDIEVNKILVSLDINEAVIDEAIEKGVKMIFTHHAPLFNPIKKLDYSSQLAKIIHKSMEHDISIFVAHTNLDIVDGGVNDALADKFNIQNKKILNIRSKKKLKKIVVFVPQSHHEQVLNALTDAGAGFIGNYSHCSFNSTGIGTFYAGKSTNPFIGKRESLSRVEEVKIETIYRSEDENKIIKAIIDNHPYEEIAYDIYELDNIDKVHGIGRIGNLPEKRNLACMTRDIKKLFNLESLQVIGANNIDESKIIISTVAVCGGSGGKFIQDAIDQSADLYITGEVSYHDAQYAADHNLIVIPVGHYHSEVVVVPAVAKILREEFKKQAVEIEVIESKVLTLPYKYL